MSLNFLVIKPPIPEFSTLFAAFSIKIWLSLEVTYVSMIKYKCSEIEVDVKLKNLGMLCLNHLLRRLIKR